MSLNTLLEAAHFIEFAKDTDPKARGKCTWTRPNMNIRLPRFNDYSLDYAILYLVLLSTMIKFDLRYSDLISSL
jgi:hypothetical protein